MTDTSITKPAENPGIKIAVEMGPLLLFFGTYMFGPRLLGVSDQDALFPATAVFIVAMIASIIASWRITGGVPPMLWVSGGVVVITGSLTLILHDKTFIFMKPTIVNGLFSSAILGGLLAGRSVMKMLFQAAFPPISDRGWFLLSRNWGCFFLFLAILNEVVWRTQTETFWVSFKVWGVLPLTLGFMLTQLPVMNRHLADQSTND